tara:strand:+ start:1098 stop:1460 length:363 start_codon:yes stop_codon:yes gene_type:complete
MVIDFSDKTGHLSEGYSDAFGQVSQYLLGKMFGASDEELMHYAWLTMKEEDSNESGDGFIIRGKYRDIKSYAQALGRERDYILSLEKYGEDHMRTTKAKAELDQATNHFERLTGIQWPFK